AAQAACRARAAAGAIGRGDGPAGSGRLRPRIWCAAAEAGDSAVSGEPAGAGDPAREVRAGRHHPGAGGRGQDPLYQLIAADTSTGRPVPRVALFLFAVDVGCFLGQLTLGLDFVGREIAHFTIGALPPDASAAV